METIIPAANRRVKIRQKLWTRDQYDKVVAGGIFTPEDKLELVEGELYEKKTPHPPHASVMMKFQRWFSRNLPDSYDFRNQLPLALGSRSEPEADFAVVVTSLNDYNGEHPKSALLVIEVADSSLKYDQGKKAAMYAKAGIADYWIVNINERVIEVYRDPVKVNGRGRYETKLRFAEGETVTPLAFENITVAVTDVLP